MQVNESNRSSVLEIDSNPNNMVGQVVKGNQSYKYKLTGAPLSWNAVGIAESL
jgi:hypothetical protein